ncbi:MAG: cytochrome c [Hyphomonadaceae bacterium]|nr:cytochrome c [Hyphomonadaceae bacterium]
MSFLRQAGEEIAEHPAETAALLAMVVAMSRLLRSRKRKPAQSGDDMLQRRRSVIPISVMAALCILGLASCATDDARAIAVAPDPNSYGREYADDFTNAGRQIAEQSCASCHAIGGQTRSPHPDAPPMNTLLSRYDPNTLADDLIAGIRVGHDDMPLFDFNVIAADSLIAYLESISPKVDPR